AQIRGGVEPCSALLARWAGHLCGEPAAAHPKSHWEWYPTPMMMNKHGSCGRPGDVRGARNGIVGCEATIGVQVAGPPRLTNLRLRSAGGVRRAPWGILAAWKRAML